MKKLLVLALLIAVPVFAAPQTQADVTITYTIKAADATALKAALIALAGSAGPMGRVNDVSDIIDGNPIITDVNLQAWAKKQLKQQIDQTNRQHDEMLLRAAQPDISTLTTEQKAAYLAFLKTLKK